MLADKPFREQPWLSGLAMFLLLAGGFSGQITVDRYHDSYDYLPPVIFISVALWVAWRAIRSGIRWDWILGRIVLALAGLLIVWMLYDRTTIAMGCRVA